MLYSSPTPEEIAHALTRAVDYLRTKALRSPSNRHFSSAALAEQIAGMWIPPRPLKDGWWVVGLVVDDTDPECDEYSVWLLPGKKRLRLVARYEPAMRAHPKQRRRYFSGATKRWEINPNIPEDEENLEDMEFINTSR